MELRNPFIFAPIKTGYGIGDGMVIDRHLRFYERRAGHLGAVIPEPFYLDRSARELPGQMGIDDDDKLPGLGLLVKTMHEGGARIIAHLNHPGRMANPKIPGNVFVSSTDQPCENGGAVPERLDEQQIAQVVELYASAAERAERAGFDALELQFGHGYLAAQFMSPKVNARTDRYGGSFSDRMRFPLEVLDAVIDRTSLPVIARISGDEMVPGGMTLDEMKRFSTILAERSVLAVHVSAGTVCSSPPWFFQHMFVPKGKTWEMARAIKEAAGVPVIAVGRVNRFADVDELLSDSRIDYIAIGRALLADPDFVAKYRKKVPGVVMPCLACAEGCLGGVKAGQGLSCLVNPEAGKEESVLQPAEQPKKIAVVGGGLAGMQAAVTLRQRGHDVTVFEKEALGGQFRYAPLTPHKRSMDALIPAFIQRLEELTIPVVMKEAKVDDLVGWFDAAIVATGSLPEVPDIEGLKQFFWAEVLEEENLPANAHVLIIGGGLIGVDIATALIPRNNRVTIVKRTTDFGEDMEMIAKKLSLAMLKKSDVTFSDKTHIRKIEGKTVHAERGGQRIRFEGVDTIVVSTGMQPHKPLVEHLQGKLPVFVIGDAKEVGNAQDAITHGWRTALDISI